LLKSTLLQLDSSFSERDYGAGTFREFADKLASQGLVVLKHQGRSTLVELPVSESSQEALEPQMTAPEPATQTELLEQPESSPQEPLPRDASLGEGVALVRRALAEAITQPRWPMYPRQFKQFLRTVQPDFDERKYGSIADLMRACQKDGLLRLERDRQGALRVFASGGGPRASVPHGWGRGGDRDHDVAQSAAEADGAPVLDLASDAVAEPESAPVVDADVAPVIESAQAEDEAPAPKAKRGAKAKKAKRASGAKRAKSAKRANG
jgi:hypothetical protein